MRVFYKKLCNKITIKIHDIYCLARPHYTLTVIWYYYRIQFQTSCDTRNEEVIAGKR